MVVGNHLLDIPPLVREGGAEEGDNRLVPLNAMLPHLPIFEYIDRVHGSRLTYLAERANITAQAMGELVDHLARHGYVERVPDPSDGRAKLVRLTEQGAALYALAGRLVADLEATWAGYIGERKMLQLKRLLAELWEAIEARDAAELDITANSGDG